MKLHFRNLDYVTPPGALTEIVSHPFHGETSSMEVSLFNDHRYAFFFWNKWTREITGRMEAEQAPCLVTIDWHQDLMYPSEQEKKWLDKLDLSNNKDVSLYTWANLTPINDGQIMAAVYLNLIGNVYVLCRQGTFESHWEDENYIDKYGNNHIIKKFKRIEDIEAYVLSTDETAVYFDIDLDFFTIQNPLNGKGKKFTYLSKKEIREMLQPVSPFINWIFRRIMGFTIAIEPEHTGGLSKANGLLDTIDKLYFKPGLFSNYGNFMEKNTDWKHLKKG